MSLDDAISKFIHLVESILIFVPAIFSLKKQKGLSFKNVQLRQVSTWTNTKKVLIHWGQDKMIAISQKAFSSAISWMKTFEFEIKFHWNMFFSV